MLVFKLFYFPFLMDNSKEFNCHEFANEFHRQNYINVYCKKI